MGHRQLGPWILVIAIVALGAFGYRTQSYPFPPYVQCSYELARSGRLPPDLLIFGTSRVGRSVDSAYIARRLSAASGRDISVERIAITGGNIPQFNVLSRTYLRHRGAPKVVVMQLAYNRFPEDLARMGLPIHRQRNIAFGTLDDLWTVQETARLTPRDAVLPRMFERGFRPWPAVVIDKVLSNVYAGIHYPAAVLLKKDRYPNCSEDALQRQASVWLYNNLADDRQFSIEATSAQTLAIWKEEARRFAGLSPSAPVRFYENDQLHQLIDLYEAQGSKVILAIYPQITERFDERMRAELTREFPNNRVIEFITVINGPNGTAGEQLYHDAEHLNPNGALVVSRTLADLLAEEVH